MYQDHFGLNDDPFALGPNLRFLFRSRAHAETMAHLGYGLEQGEDIVLISGAIGTGKTLALHNLQAKVSKLFRQVLVNVTQLTFDEFLKMVLHELGETWPDNADTADLLVRLKDRATGICKEGRKILLVVDEAQNLEPDTLEGIRLLTNIGQPDRQVFQIVLSGQPALEAMVERPEMAQLRQRIRIHYRLEPLSTEETGEYVAHRLAVAGRREPLFTDAAIRKIHALSGGIPRLVNHLAGHALLVAFVDKDRKVDAKHVAADEMPHTPEPAAGAVKVNGRRDIPAAPTPAPVGVEKPPMTPPSAPEPVAEPESEPDPKPDPEPAPPREPVMAEPDRPPLEPAAPVEPTRRRERRRGGRGWIWAAVIVVVAVGAWFLLRGDLTSWAQRPEPARTPPPPTQAATPDPAPQPIDPAGGTDDPVTEPAAGTGDQVAVAVAANHWLHVASFREELRAERYRDTLARAGAGAEVREAVLSDGEHWYRVLLGPFDGEAAAEEAAKGLESAGLITFHRVLPE